jgi:hypothetical protein
VATAGQRVCQKCHASQSRAARTTIPSTDRYIGGVCTKKGKQVERESWFAGIPSFQRRLESRTRTNVTTPMRFRPYPFVVCVLNHYFGHAEFITATPYLMQVLRPTRVEPLEPTALVSFQMLQWKTLTYFNLKAGF